MTTTPPIQLELRNINEAPTLTGHTPYAHVAFQVATRDSRHWSDDPVRGIYFKDNLQIRCQIDDRDHCPARDHSPSYSWEVFYHQPYAVDVPVAGKMLKTLKLIEQRLEKLRDQFGSPRTYGEYVVRIANILQAHLVFYEQYPNGRRFENYRCEKPGECIHRIDELVLDHWRACRKLAGKSEAFAVPEPQPQPEPVTV